MTQAKRLVELAERCEAAAGDSFDLNHAIAQALGICSEPFTASLDAAMTLVPEGCEWRIERRHSKGMFPAYASLWGKGARDVDRHDNGTGKTPALALCAAALKARAQSPGESRD